MDADPKPEYLTDEQAGAYIGYSARQIRRWREQGKIPYYRPQREVRIKKSDLDAFMEAHRVEGIQSPTSDLRSMLDQISRTVKHRKRPGSATPAAPQKERTKEKEIGKEIHERENAPTTDEHIREGDLVFTVTEHKKLREQWGGQFPRLMIEVNEYNQKKQVLHPYKLASRWQFAPEQPGPGPGPRTGRRDPYPDGRGLRDGPGEEHHRVL